MPFAWLISDSNQFKSSQIQMNPFPQPPSSNASQQQQLMKLLQSNPQLLQKYQEQVSRMQAQAKSQHPPMTSQQYLSKLPNIQKFLDSEGGLVIEPSPNFVLKFFEKRTNQKIFVNILTHEIIDHPEQKLLVDFENQPGLRIPMSMGRVREDHDKNGNVCKVVDVVLNPKIVQTAETSPDILGFTAQIIGNYLLEKHKIAVLDDQLKKVKGLKYKGTKVECQRVKGKKAPKIEQLSEQEQKQKQMQNKHEEQLFNELNQQTLNKSVMRPQFQILAYNNQNKYEPYSIEVQQYSHLKIQIAVPHLIHSKGIHLEASLRLIYLSVRNLYELCLKVPFEVGKVKSRFSRRQRKLQVFVFREALKDKNNNNSIKQTKVVDLKVDQIHKTLIDKQSDINRAPQIVNLNNDLLYDLV